MATKELTRRKTGPKERPLAERFWEKVKKSDGCWGWTHSKNSKGYGRIGIGTWRDRRVGMAHRVSWELHYGPIPKGLCVCHRCDNPACVRPDHLFLGTKAENNIDMTLKGRRRNGTTNGEQHPCAKLSAAQVLEIRSAAGSQQSIADRHGVSQVLVSQIKRLKIWKHL